MTVATMIVTRNGVTTTITWTRPSAVLVQEAAPTDTQVILQVGNVVIEEVEVVVADTSVTSFSKITVNLVSNDHNEVGDLADDRMRVFAIPEEGQIRFILVGSGHFVGPFTLNYGVLN